MKFLKSVPKKSFYFDNNIDIINKLIYSGRKICEKNECSDEPMIWGIFISKLCKKVARYYMKEKGVEARFFLMELQEVIDTTLEKEIRKLGDKI